MMKKHENKHIVVCVLTYHLQRPYGFGPMAVTNEEDKLQGSQKEKIWFNLVEQIVPYMIANK